MKSSSTRRQGTGSLRRAPLKPPGGRENVTVSIGSSGRDFLATRGAGLVTHSSFLWPPLECRLLLVTAGTMGTRGSMTGGAIGTGGILSMMSCRAVFFFSGTAGATFFLALNGLIPGIRVLSFLGEVLSSFGSLTTILLEVALVTAPRLENSS